MKLSARLLSSVFALHFICIHSVPIPERKNSRHKALPGWLQKFDFYNVKKGSRQFHTQDTVKEVLTGNSSLAGLLQHGNSSDLWKRPRCGVPDYPQQKGMHGKLHRQKRFVLFGGRWEKTDLTYKIMRFPWQMSKAKVQQILTEALKVWSDVTPLTFTEISEGRADIIIDFTRSRYVWRIRNGRLQEGYPALASRHWRGIPEHIDAAFEDGSGNIWFFQGHSYWIYDGERQVSGPNSVQSLGLPISDIQAALMWGPEKNKKIYLFKSGSYWRFNPAVERVDEVYPRSILDWRGIPMDIDAAFQDSYGYAHFLQGSQYWKFDPVAVKALEGYPRLIGQDFFSCRGSPNNY
ncbi:UNVERIFIED_CONTAM: hypothetical protein FKN15_020159 [Acipenser sinensis]